jgi:hypothetical protein
VEAGYVTDDMGPLQLLKIVGPILDLHGVLVERFNSDAE